MQTRTIKFGKKKKSNETDQLYEVASTSAVKFKIDMPPLVQGIDR